MLKTEGLRTIETSVFEKPLPYYNPEVFYTQNGTAYLQEPGVAVTSIPYVDFSGAEKFLEGFPKELKFYDYFNDPIPLPPSEALSKHGGQLCYFSFGEKRTWNKDAATYFLNILDQAHGSVMEHSNITVVLWGISRSLTHELVRHRAGFAYSQVSQRYVGGQTLRFVERPEYASDAKLHDLFQEHIDYSAKRYESISDYLYELQESGHEILNADRKTDLRKKVRQTARSILPNETEAPIQVTGNIRAWRHFLNMRCSQHAEIEIRRASFEIYRCLNEVAPLLFADFDVVNFSDGTQGLTTLYPKV